MFDGRRGSGWARFFLCVDRTAWGIADADWRIWSVFCGQVDFLALARLGVGFAAWIGCGFCCVDWVATIDYFWQAWPEATHLEGLYFPLLRLWRQNVGSGIRN